MTQIHSSLKTVRQRVAAKALICHGSRVLIIREAPTYKDGTQIGRYQLPGGRIEPGEKFMDGLLREVREETGLEVTVGQPICVGEWFPVIGGESNQIVAVFFVCQAQTNVVTLSDKHDDYQWIEPKDHKLFELPGPVVTAFEAYLNLNR